MEFMIGRSYILTLDRNRFFLFNSACHKIKIIIKELSFILLPMLASMKFLCYLVMLPLNRTLVFTSNLLNNLSFEI